MFLCDYGYHLVFKVNKHGLHLQGSLRTYLCAFAAAVAFLRLNYYVIFTRPVLITIIRYNLYHPQRLRDFSCSALA
jgi:hypothetical protein